jgi:hypothetical protein
MITKEELDGLYEQWSRSPGYLRFGQLFCNKYHMTYHKLFYTNDAIEAYQMILEHYVEKDDE